MILGIGIDMVRISEMKRLLEDLGSGALDLIFTERERAECREKALPEENYAACFAAKEAVFKAVAHLLPEKSFDMRKSETAHREDGSPYIEINPYMLTIMEKAGICRLHLSITTEEDFAVAFVIAEGEVSNC